jgi:hypothetical protein
VEFVFALVVADERDPRLGASLVQHDRRGVAAERVGVLAQLPRLQVQRPDVIDVAVARNLRVNRLGRIGRRRREHQRLGVEELRGGIVVRAERQLGLLAGRHIKPEQLLVAADPRDVDDRSAVGRPARAGVGESVLGDVGHFARGEIDDPDVAYAPLQRGECDLLSVRRNIGRFRVINGSQLDPLLDVTVEDVLQDQRAPLFRADEVGDLVP